MQNKMIEIPGAKIRENFGKSNRPTPHPQLWQRDDMQMLPSVRAEPRMLPAGREVLPEAHHPHHDRRGRRRPRRAPRRDGQHRHRHPGELEPINPFHPGCKNNFFPDFLHFFFVFSLFKT